MENDISKMDHGKIFLRHDIAHKSFKNQQRNDTNLNIFLIIEIRLALITLLSKSSLHLFALWFVFVMFLTLVALCCRYLISIYERSIDMR